MRRSAWALLCAVLWVVPIARADGPTTARLSFVREERAEACPDEAALRERVAARLGRDPFVADALLGISVRIEPLDGAGYRAVIELDDEGETTRRELTSARGDCADLADALALALSLAVDPASLLAPAPRADPPPPPPPTATAAPDPTPVVEPAPEPPRDDVSARFSALVLGSWGAAPEFSGGLGLSGGFRVAAFSLDLELRAEIPTEIAGVNGVVRGAPITAALVPCAHADIVTMCGVIRAGAFWAESVDAAEVRSAAGPYVALGARGGLELPLTPSVALAILGEVSAPLVGAELRLGSERVWETPPVNVSLGVGVVGALR